MSLEIDECEKAYNEGFEDGRKNGMNQLELAAPDLLAALKALLVEYESGMPPDHENWLPIELRLVNDAKAAIAKATGG